jgi:hypothetical protein
MNLVLPETTRLINRNWEKNVPFVGIYKVNQKVVYNGTEHIYSKIVFILPVPILFLIVVAGGLVFLLIRRSIKTRKRLKKLEDELKNKNADSNSDKSDMIKE